MNKIDVIKEVFKEIDPMAELIVEPYEDGSATVYGPFPSFMLHVEEIGPVRALIHVNADAPNMAYIFSKFQEKLSIAHDGAFAIDQSTSKVLFAEDAYEKKESNILMFANEILGRRNKEKAEKLYVPEEKKIILS